MNNRQDIRPLPTPRFLPAAVAALALLLLAGTTLPAQQNNQVKLHVVVLDIDGKAIPNAYVRFENTETRRWGERTADTRGHCKPYYVRPGVRYHVAPKVQGYKFDDGRGRIVQINKDQTIYFKGKALTINRPPAVAVGPPPIKATPRTLGGKPTPPARQQKKLELRVVVLDNDGKAIPNAHVRFVNTETQRWGERNSDTNGRCEPYHVVPGVRYQVEPKAQGYRFEDGRGRVVQLGKDQTIYFKADPLTARAGRGSRGSSGSGSGTSNLGTRQSGQTAQQKTYEVTLRTADVKKAGTYSGISLTLHTERGERGPFHMNLGEISRGDVDRVQFDDYDAGRINRVTVASDGKWPVNKSTFKVFSDDIPAGDVGWLPETIAIRDTRTGERLIVPCYRWIRSVEGRIGQYGNTIDGERTLRTPVYGDGAWERTLTAFPESEIGDYRITVHTGNAERAGTDAEVYLTIFDQNGDALPKVLLEDKKDNFEAGDTDVFPLRLPGVEDISSIVIGHNNNPRYDNNEWYLHRVEIELLSGTPRKWTFPIDRMLASNRPGRQDVTVTAFPERTSVPGVIGLPPVNR